jgi:hypothetical protein
MPVQLFTEVERARRNRFPDRVFKNVSDAPGDGP